MSFRQFGTLPIGIFFSNLDWRHLMTSPRILFGQICNMSIFGISRAICNFGKNGYLHKIKDISKTVHQLFHIQIWYKVEGWISNMMGPFLVECNTLKGLLQAIKAGTLGFWHICDTLKGTWHWLICSRISAYVWLRVLYIPWFGSLDMFDGLLSAKFWHFLTYWKITLIFMWWICGILTHKLAWRCQYICHFD